MEHEEKHFLVFLRVSSSFVRGFVFGVFGLSGVMDLGDVSTVAINGVGDGLSATIGQQNIVGSGDDFTVAALLVAEVVVGVVIDDLVGEVVRHRGLLNPLNNIFIDAWILLELMGL